MWMFLLISKISSNEVWHATSTRRYMPSSLMLLLIKAPQGSDLVQGKDYSYKLILLEYFCVQAFGEISTIALSVFNKRSKHCNVRFRDTSIALSGSVLLYYTCRLAMIDYSALFFVKHLYSPAACSQDWILYSHDTEFVFRLPDSARCDASFFFVIN